MFQTVKGFPFLASNLEGDALFLSDRSEEETQMMNNI